MIWLVGNKGMLGAELSAALSEAGIDTVGTDREVSILEPAALEAFARSKRPSWIINCAAYTAVEKAEEEAPLAARLNEEGPHNLAKLASLHGAKLLHISTDYVFDGSGTRPYLEEDPLAPLGVYGRTKAAGEARVREACAEHVILRTAWLYGRHGPNFVYTMLRLMSTKDRVGVVHDQRGTPTYARDLAMAILAIVGKPAARYGTYHFTNSGETSWYDFAVEIQKLGLESGILGKACAVEALTTEQYPTKVKRPAYSVLSKDKMVREYSILPKPWQESLEKHIYILAKEASDPEIRAFLGRS
jgi:dTDP-4-dehydrorhamnose reductase